MGQIEEREKALTDLLSAIEAFIPIALAQDEKLKNVAAEHEKGILTYQVTYSEKREIIALIAEHANGQLLPIVSVLVNPPLPPMKLND